MGKPRTVQTHRDPLFNRCRFSVRLPRSAPAYGVFSRLEHRL
ncbi:hypothetical protein GLE_2285 [Lysobacter enzymogenes]|uniref:Uncharacterized protein n=1 Tax=Lysobacter enzymogenes TaxID=69 RepID=A0A0S2DGJ8_LYSEN|nr:hypothetical protein GLE_2285 [Lysobacter enzymogenes]